MLAKLKAIPYAARGTLYAVVGFYIVASPHIPTELHTPLMDLAAAILGIAAYAVPTANLTKPAAPNPESEA